MRLRPGRYRGYSVRRRKPELMVGLAGPCDLCRCRVSTIDDPGFWITAGDWHYVALACPECGTVNISAEYVKARQTVGVL